MAISLQSLNKGVSKLPPRILMYGEEKIGKSSFAASAPNPVFLRTEDGEGNIDMKSWDITNYDEMFEALTVLAKEEHDFNTLVVDTLDWFEPMVYRKLMVDRPKNDKGKDITNVDDYGYGKGYVFAMDYWNRLVDALNYIRNEKDMMVIMLAHAHIKSYSPPDSESYDRFSLKMNEKAAEKFMEFSDCIFFARKKVFLRDDNTGRIKAVGSSDGREIMTESQPPFRAGNRYNLPASIPFDANVWNAIAANIGWFEKFK